MFPLGLVIGAVAGATAAIMLGPQIAYRARPVAKAALKAALLALHEAQVQRAHIVEAAEDLLAEAKSEATAEVVAGFMYLGELVEFGTIEQIFTTPRDARTQRFVTGRFG